MRRICLVIASSVIGLTSCANRNDDGGGDKDQIGLVTPPDKEPLKVLPLNAKWASWAAVPWEKRCEGLQDILEAFQKSNLPEFTFAPSTLSGSACEIYKSRTDRPEERYRLPFQLSTASKTLIIEAELVGGVKPEGFGVNLTWRKDENTLVDVQNSPELSALNPNFRHFDYTLDDWYHKDKSETLIFGRTYSKYLAEIQDTFGVPAGALIAKNPDIKIKLSMDPKVSGEGIAEFTEVDIRTFENRALLGCKDFDCLKTSKVKFSVLGTKLIFDREIESNDGTTLLSTWQFRLDSWPLGFE